MGLQEMQLGLINKKIIREKEKTKLEYKKTKKITN